MPRRDLATKTCFERFYTGAASGGQDEVRKQAKWFDDDSWVEIQ